VIISPKYDYVVKELFRDETILRYFISDVLGIRQESIRSLRLRNTFLWKRHKKQKLGILDVVVELNDDTKIDIELQAKVCDSWDKRQLFYLSKLYTEDLQSGQDYSHLRKCVGISILDFNLSNRKKYHTVYYLMDEEGNKLSDMLEVHVLELNKKLTGQGEVDDWIRFFNIRTEEDLKMIKTKNLGILKAIGELERLSMSNPLRLRYEAYLKRVRDDRAWRIYVWKEARAEGKAEGRAEGKAEGRAEAIIYLLESRGKVPEKLKLRILEEKDLDRLQQWLTFAAASGSVGEFQKKLDGE